MYFFRHIQWWPLKKKYLLYYEQVKSFLFLLFVVCLLFLCAHQTSKQLALLLSLSVRDTTTNKIILCQIHATFCKLLLFLSILILYFMFYLAIK